MKTKELIKTLQELDPEGEIEVNVAGRDIYFAEVLPGHYDGGYSILIRDPEEAPFYNIHGIKLCRTGTKIELHTMGYKDVIWDQDMNEMSFEYDSDSTRERYESEILKEQEHYNKQIKEIEEGC